MHWQRKINRGFAALVIILLALVTYRIILNQSRKSEQPDLMRLTEDYLVTAVRHEFIDIELWEDYNESDLTLEAFVAGDAYESYYNEVRTALAPFYQGDGKYLDFAMNRLQRKWETQLSSPSHFSASYNLGDFEDFWYLDDSVRISFFLSYTLSGEQSTVNQVESIYFEKEGNEWKVVTADFQTQYLSDRGGWW